MDRETLRAVVVDYRDNKGMTFDQIAKELVQRGIVSSTTRQGVQGMYARAKEREANAAKEAVAATDIVTRADVVNLYVLGYNMSQIEILLKNSNSNISYARVRQIIKGEKEYIDRARDTKVIIVKKLISSGEKVDIELAKSKLSYKGMEPTEDGVRTIMCDAYTEYIRDLIGIRLADIQTITEDSQLVREVANRFGCKYQALKLD